MIDWKNFDEGPGGVFLGTASGDRSPEVMRGREILLARLESLLGPDLAAEALASGVCRKVFARLTEENLTDAHMCEQLKNEINVLLASWRKATRTI